MGVPVRAILLGTLFGYGAVVMSYVSPDTIFAFLVNSYGTVAIFVYVLIAVSQLRLRARLEKEDPARLRVRMWAYPYLTYLAIAGMLGIVLAMAFIPEQRTPLIFGVISLGPSAAGFLRTRLLRQKAGYNGTGGGAASIPGVVAGARAIAARMFRRPYQRSPAPNAPRHMAPSQAHVSTRACRSPQAHGATRRRMYRRGHVDHRRHTAPPQAHVSDAGT